MRAASSINRRGALSLAALLLTVAACGDDSATMDPDMPEITVDLEALFAAPSAAEIQAIEDEWAARSPAAAAVQVEATSQVTVGGFDLSVRVVSHEVDGNRHYGAIIVPDGAMAGSLPVLVFSHGGDGGINLDVTLPLLPFAFGEFQDDFVIAVPSFRSEPFVFEDVTYTSEGEPSPWDRDVDDALALVEVTLESTPEADPERIAVLGFSRGAGVGLLMAERDPRIDVVVEFFGPSDFFGPFVQEVVRDALLGELRDLPGLAFLDEKFIQPLAREELTIAEVRLELVRRSAVFFAERLPQLQVHHGTDDAVVPVGEAEQLIAVMQGLGRGEPDFEFFIYEGGGHDPLGLTGSLERTQAFLERAFDLFALVVAGRTARAELGSSPGL